MNIKKITISSMMIAVVAVLTMSVAIPVPQTKGYLNAGDVAILFSSFFFGPMIGMIAGGIGSAIADLMLGAAYWAPFTLIIKGLMGLVMGIMCKNVSKDKIIQVKVIIGFLLAEIIMVFGYFLVGVFMYGVAAAIASSLMNMIQGAFGILGFIVLGKLASYPLRSQISANK